MHPASQSHRRPGGSPRWAPGPTSTSGKRRSCVIPSRLVTVVRAWVRSDRTGISR
ncbi:MAG: hypothetical protein AVDCRST_MAG41-1075 [uncultured Corynebacteriales bacterium]|uniref:Uncharacterized protein n=1 Tax=uncultured Mycobacteriales bacterium TaxID=581187 RepID=A0A6J4HV92_9ACTN|nr:MAG: hypothetical protein AVDCRST_MAG41-1075 [uncultured Corynebacteriales bacterium]